MKRALRLRKHSATTICIFILLCVMTFTFLYPLWYMVVNALKTKQQYYMNQFSLPPSLNFKNFTSIIVDFKILTYFASSMIVCVTSVVLILGFALFASYAFAKLRFKGKGIAYACILATMFMPGQVSMIPAYVMFAKVGLIDNYWSVILSYLAAALPAAILLMNGSITGIPNELLESARIDGAGYFRTVGNVVLPLSVSAIAINVIFNFIGYWNDLLTPMLYLSAPEKQTVMVALTGLVQKTSSLPTYQLAGLLISVLPAVILYLLLQKFMIKGMMVGSIK